MEKCCGNCKYNTYYKGERVCDNHDGEYYGEYVEWGEKCPDWEEKDD